MNSILSPRFVFPSDFSAVDTVVSAGALASLRGVQSSKILVVVSRSIWADESLKKKIERSFRRDCVFECLGFDQDPRLSDVSDLVAKIEDHKPDLITAIGGGRLIDTCKAAWMIYEHPQIDLLNYSPARYATLRLRRLSRFCVVPTTVGSGSESSTAALMMDGEGKKVPIVHRDFHPDVVILDPELVVGLPKEIVVDSVCDSLSHAIEGYVSKVQNQIMESYALLSIQLIKNSWQTFLSDRDLASASSLQQASYIAGKVQNHCLVGASHSIAHAMAKEGYAHGLLNGFFLPGVIRFNMQDKLVSEKYENLSKSAGLIDPEGLIDLLHEVRSNLQTSIVVPKDRRSEIVERCVRDISTRTNPKAIESDDFEAILLGDYGN